jgi:3-methyl-2-oxobutanoate hydroxymethyltransferase
MVVMDMPFMSYQVSVEQALTNAGRLMKEAHGNAVKLEGGAAVCPQIKAMTSVGIPVMAHLGMTPQSVNAFGGNKVQGKTSDAAKRMLDDAYKIQEAGAFAVVLECVPAPLAALITEKLTIPTIGIGAGNETDGQILVYQDMLGMFSDYVPKFVKKFANLGQKMTDAFTQYDQEVKSTAFPDKDHEFHKMSNPEVLDELKNL